MQKENAELRETVLANKKPRGGRKEKPKGEAAGHTAWSDEMEQAYQCDDAVARERAAKARPTEGSGEA
jgi:hypothetical protein